MAENYYYFDGDPETDSARRHLERVLKEPTTPHRKWPWVLAAVAGVATWYFWPRGTKNGDTPEGPKGASQEGSRA
jgi:hypothetical protein